LRASIRSLITNNSWLQGQLDNDTDFFEAGLDSLQLPQLIAQLNTFLSASNPGSELFSTKTMFANPTVDKLACFIEEQKYGEED
jgi:acyl carrier protein